MIRDELLNILIAGRDTVSGFCQPGSDAMTDFRLTQDGSDFDICGVLLSDASGCFRTAKKGDIGCCGRLAMPDI